MNNYLVLLLTLSLMAVTSVVSQVIFFNEHPDELLHEFGPQ